MRMVPRLTHRALRATAPCWRARDRRCRARRFVRSCRLSQRLCALRGAAEVAGATLRIHQVDPGSSIQVILLDLDLVRVSSEQLLDDMEAAIEVMDLDRNGLN